MLKTNNGKNHRQENKDTIMLSIEGMQKDAAGEETLIKLITKGQLYEKNEISYITYKENIDVTGAANKENLTTMLKLSPENMVLLRSGAIEQRQVFRLGQLCTSTYNTPYGIFEMGVLTNIFQVSRSEYGKISGVNIEYDLHLDGHWQSTNTLSITIKEEKGNGRQSYAKPGN